MANCISQFDSINLAIKNLTSRIDNVENLDYKFWIPTIIAIGSILYSIYQIHIQNKRELYFNLEDKIDNSRLLLTDKSISIANSPDDIETKLKLIDVYVEDLLNKYDGACRYYNRNKINKKEFEHKYNASIIKLVEQYKIKFDATTPYNNMLKYYKEKHLKQ